MLGFLALKKMLIPVPTKVNTSPIDQALSQNKSRSKSIEKRGASVSVEYNTVTI